MGIRRRGSGPAEPGRGPAEASPPAPGARRDPSATRLPATESQEPAPAWWEWPLVVLLLPVTGAHRVLARLESLAAAAGRVVGAAVGRAWHAAITRPLLGLLGAARVPLRWLGQAARRLLAAPLRVLAAAALLGPVRQAPLGAWPPVAAKG